MKKKMIFVLLAMFMAAPTFAGIKIGKYTVSDWERDTTSVPGYVISKVTVQEGSNPLNRFIIHRVKKELPHGVLHPIMLMPSGGSKFDVYEIADGGDFLTSTAGYLASHGFDVFGYTPRAALVPAGSCEDGTNDCSVMSGWGLDKTVDDTELVRSVVKLFHPLANPVIGGWSLGGLIGYAAANKYPNHYSGLFIYEALANSDDEAVRSGNAISCTYYQSLVDAGQFANSQMYAPLQYMYGLMLQAPQDDSPIIPGFTNRQAFLYATTTPMDPPDGEVPGYTYFSGSWQEDKYNFADEARIGAVAVQLNYYDPNPLVRDYICAFAGVKDYSSNLVNYTAPVIVFKSGHGIGNYADDTLNLLGSTDITTYEQPDFGHGDYLGSPNHIQLLEEPLKAWMLDKVFK